MRLFAIALLVLIVLFYALLFLHSHFVSESYSSVLGNLLDTTPYALIKRLSVDTLWNSEEYEKLPEPLGEYANGVFSSNLYRFWRLMCWNGKWAEVAQSNDIPRNLSLPQPMVDPSYVRANYIYRSDIGIFVSPRNVKTYFDEQNSYALYGFQMEDRFFLLEVGLRPDVVKVLGGKLGLAIRGSYFAALIMALFLAGLIAFLSFRGIERYTEGVRDWLEGRRYELPPASLARELNVLYEEFERKHQEEMDAIRLQSRRQVDEYEQRISFLSVYRHISSLYQGREDVGDFLMAALDIIITHYKGAFGTVYLIMPGKKPQIYTTYNFPPNTRQMLLDVFKGLEERKIPHQGYMTLDSVESFATPEVLESAKEMGIIGLIRIPLMLAERCVGAVHIYVDSPPDDIMVSSERISAFIELFGHTIASINARNELELQIKETIALYELSKILISATDYELLLEQILWIIQESFGFSNCAILLTDKETNELYVKSSWGFDLSKTQQRFKIGKEGVMGRVAATGDPLIVDDVKECSFYIGRDESVRSELAVPLIVEGDVIGVLNTESDIVGRFTERDKWFLSSFAAQATLAIERARLYERIKEQATHDGLTGLYNRQHLDRIFDEQGEEMLLKSGSLTVIMLDMNYLKEINDTYGHKAGDDVLREMGNFLTKTFPAEIVTRYGGDEFVVLLPGVGDAQARRLVENLREKKLEWASSLKRAYRVDFAAGYATATATIELRKLMENADKNMYKDKDKGKHRGYSEGR